MQAEERQLVARLFRWGVQCLSVFTRNPAADADGGEGKEAIDAFAGAFTVLEPYNLRTTVGPHIPALYAAMLDDTGLLSVPQQLLANSMATLTMADVLLTFLVAQMDDLKAQALLRASVLMRLFKLVLGSVSLFGPNETVLRPHLQTIILSCLRYTTRVNNPLNYYLLLRALFRSIAGGKFDHSYKEILPILPLLLTELSKLYSTAQDDLTRAILIELCLTVPVRLASLLPHLPLMLRLMVRALSAQQRGELHGLALRTLEFWVDNLMPDYCCAVLSQDPALQTDIMAALCSNLRPPPYPFGTIALRLVGKLGGRNRHFLPEAMALPMAPTPWNADVCLQVIGLGLGQGWCSAM
ncbi:hypothetical protein JKP88DRAFT_169897 [Tribonema minus]|uniref:Uncharacterized protein n=1 Tax=Tribonema minus TaxID=303371 RepID=A0A835YLJ6_9STRA|nr:hypothetical protein JKP88DRAFT_169897 [Tribonema minus]